MDQCAMNNHLIIFQVPAVVQLRAAVVFDLTDFLVERLSAGIEAAGRLCRTGQWRIDFWRWRS